MKAQEFTAKRYGWEIIARKTAKGWMVDVQSHVGWKRYFLADSLAGKMTNQPNEYQVRMLVSYAIDCGKRMGVPPNRGVVKTVKDPFGFEMRVKV